MARYTDFDSYYNNESEIGRKKYLESINKENKKNSELKQIKEFENKKRQENYSKSIQGKIQSTSKNISNTLAFKGTKPEVKIKQPRFSRQGQMLSREQDMLQDMFGGHENQVICSAKGNSLPRMDGILRSGGGLINNYSGGRTGRFFGIFR